MYGCYIGEAGAGGGVLAEPAHSPHHGPRPVQPGHQLLSPRSYSTVQRSLTLHKGIVSREAC